MQQTILIAAMLAIIEPASLIGVDSAVRDYLVAAVSAVRRKFRPCSS
jgi:hypothetical protein